MKICFTILSPPRTKKTSNRIVRAGRFPKVLPSRAYMDWNATAQIQLRKEGAIRLEEWYDVGAALPWLGQVNCRALFYREKDIGDAVGFYQALADCIQDRQILANDRQIVSWDGSRLLIDRTNPRIEVSLEILLSCPRGS